MNIGFAGNDDKKIIVLIVVVSTVCFVLVPLIVICFPLMRSLRKPEHRFGCKLNIAHYLSLMWI